MIFVWDVHAAHKRIGVSTPYHDDEEPNFVLVGFREASDAFPSREKMSNYFSGLGIAVKFYDDS